MAKSCEARAPLNGLALLSVKKALMVFDAESESAEQLNRTRYCGTCCTSFGMFLVFFLPCSLIHVPMTST